MSKLIQFDMFRLYKMPFRLYKMTCDTWLSRASFYKYKDLASSIILSLKRFFISVCGNHNEFVSTKDRESHISCSAPCLNFYLYPVWLKPYVVDFVHSLLLFYDSEVWEYKINWNGRHWLLYSYLCYLREIYAKWEEISQMEHDNNALYYTCGLPADLPLYVGHHSLSARTQPCPQSCPPANFTPTKRLQLSRAIGLNCSQNLKFLSSQTSPVDPISDVRIPRNLTGYSASNQITITSWFNNWLLLFVRTPTLLSCEKGTSRP